MMWLPLCRTGLNPFFARTFKTSLQLRTGRDMTRLHRYLSDFYILSLDGSCFFFKILENKLYRFFDIFKSLLFSLALTNSLRKLYASGGVTPYILLVKDNCEDSISRYLHDFFRHTRILYGADR